MLLDELGSPEVTVILRLLTDEPMNMRRFVAACQASPARSRLALERLTKLDVVDVEKSEQGALEIVEITLSRTGRDVAKHLANADAVLARAKARR